MVFKENKEFGVNDKLRLVITYDCPRACEGCCNHGREKPEIISLKDISNYKEIYITGGEPLLYPGRVVEIGNYLRQSEAKLFVYSAFFDELNWLSVLPWLDGITFTIHDKEGIHDWENLDFLIRNLGYDDLSLRVNVFRKAGYEPYLGLWKIKNNMEWIENCPLPKGEDFRMLNI